MLNVKLPVLVLSIVSTIFIFTIVITASAQTEKGIRFVRPQNWQEVLHKAKAQQKNILVDVYTTWCGPCKMMDQTVYPDSALGVLVNQNFIAIKLQMDTTKNDDLYVKSWYNDAEHLKQSAKIEAFPTLLFYNPEGQLVFKSMGYKSVKALTKIVAYADNPAVAKHFRNDLLAYQNGLNDYAKLPDLIIFVREIVGDQQLALAMAKGYKKNYLDRLSDADYLTPQHIKFIADNGGMQLVDIKDRFFLACYNSPELIDTAIGRTIAKECMKFLIRRDVVLPLLYRGDNPIRTDPDWNIIKTAINQYKKLSIEQFLLQAKIDFYYKTKNWEIYSVLRSKQIKKYPPVAGKQDIFDNLNSQAWYVFLECNERKSLERALKWSELSIEMEMPNPQPGLYDTYANILYKLGRKDEAIKYQRIAVEKNEVLTKQTGRNSGADLTINLEKMLKGQPTWPTR